MQSSPCCDGLCVQPYNTVVMLDSGALHSYFAESVVKSHYWLVDSTEAMSICLATGSEVVSNLIYTVSIVLCDISGHTIA